MPEEVRIPSDLEIVLVGAGWGTGVFLLCIGAQWLVYVEVLNNPGGIRVISASIAGAIAAFAVIRLRLQARKERVSQLRRYEVIAEMNHHIRNALQVLSLHTYPKNNEAHNLIRQSMNRINWALQDVLPRVNDLTEEELRIEQLGNADFKGHGQSTDN